MIDIMTLGDSGLTVIDLFAGVGGFRLGFEAAGFKTIFSSDFDKSCKITFDNYFGKDALYLKDIQELDASEIPDADVITAGFPCQPFSKIGKLHGFADARATLFWDLLRILKAKKPKAFVLENVKNLQSHDGGNTFKVIKEALENELGYQVHTKILNTNQFGLPQDRKRIYIVGFREETDFNFPEPIELVFRVGDILELTDVDNFYYLSQKYLSGLEKHRQRHEAKGHGFGYRVLNDDSIASALVVGNMGRERNLIQGEIKPDGLVNSVGSPLNKSGIRKMTVRECARLQGFPEDYHFPVPVTTAYRQLGNAVSVPVVSAVAEQVKTALFKEKSLVEEPILEGLDLAVAPA
jgi:DNA (cytosine-5)-methyltransferase 1